MSVPAVADEPVERDEVASLAYQGGRVRLYAISAPRLNQNCQEWRSGQLVDYACGQHAKAFLQSLVAGRDPFCVRESINGTASCYVDGRDVGLELVAAGWALARRDESERYVYAQERAREQGRQDDTPEAVRNRLKVYNDVTAPVVDFYRQRGMLKVVDGEGSMDDVFTRIVEAIFVGVDVG